MKHIKQFEKKVNIVDKYHISALLENAKDKVYIIKLMNDEKDPYGDSYKFEMFYSYNFSTDKLTKYNNVFKSLRKSRFDDRILASFDNLEDTVDELNKMIDKNKMEKDAKKYNI